MFKQVTVIGIGLIGSSLLWAMKERKIAEKIIAADISMDVCATVRRLGMADTITADLAKSVVGSDLVILAVPLGAYAAVGEVIGHMLKPGAIVTDVGSVKMSAANALKPFIPESVQMVPGHPIAGTEFSGPEAGFAELFDGRWCILTPLPDTNLKAVERMTAFWEACGSRIEIMNPEHHDLVLGITSHLPHLIAYTIVGTASDLEDDTKADVIKYSASGFRGFTRIAASDPTVWRDVFLNNKDAVLEILQRFTEDLTAMQKAIRRGDGTYLFDVFTKTRAIRREVLGLGTEGYRAPPKVIARSEGLVE